MIVARPDKEGSDEPDLKIIKYMDVGYHISLEIWSGVAPYLREIEKAQTDKFRLR